MTGWIIRRRAEAAEAVASIKHPIGDALLVFETAERAERHRTEHAPRFKVFEAAELDETGLAEVMVGDRRSLVAFVPEDEREEVAVYEVEEA
jgi:hypothetical protein